MKWAQTKAGTLLACVALAVLASLVVAGSALAAITVTGAGATFPYPLYAKWAKDYQSATGVKINYQPIGSGGGISAIEGGTVMFGGTDAPLQLADLNSHSLVQFPMTSGGVVPIVHISGVGAGRLKLTGAVLADIYMKKITKWNDSRIKSLNPGLSLPSSSIVAVHRSDGSGTTWIFTHYLQAVSSWPWADKTGSWPTGIGGKGSEGVASLVQKDANSIGYIEYSYAKQNHMAYTQMKDKSGGWVLPSAGSFKAAMSKAKWSASTGFYTVCVNESGANAWPIAGATFLLVKKSTSNYSTAHAMFKFFDWGYKSSKAISDSASLQYVPIPSKVYGSVESVWHKQVKAGGKAAW